MRTTTMVPLLGFAVVACLSACGDDTPGGGPAAPAVEVDAGAITTEAEVATGHVTFAIRARGDLDESQIQLLALGADTDPAVLAAALRDGDIPTALELAAPAGGLDLDSAETTELTIELQPGRYVWLDPDSGVASEVFTASGDAGTPPQTDGVVELGNLEISLPSGFGRGTYVVETTDEAIHGLTIVALEEPVGVDELLQLFEQDADLPGVEVVRAGNLGPNRRQIVALDLPPGDYVAASYFPDFEQGAIQAALGMFTTFTVEAEQ